MRVVEIPRVDIVMDTQSLLNYSDKLNDSSIKITRTLSRNFQACASTNIPTTAATMTVPSKKRPRKFLCINSVFVDTKSMDFTLKIACLASLIAVCLHTPKTFELLPFLEIPILISDFIATSVFTLEALLKINNMGYFVKQSSYFRDRWNQFDFFLLIANWASLLLHVYKLSSLRFVSSNLYYQDWFGLIRCLRPMIIVRLLRLILKFKVPKNRIEQLLKRSRVQIQNVTVFFVFFMAFYAIMGIQLFGRMDYRCVLPGTDPNNVTINDLMIPDAMCSKPEGGGYQCPPNMECMNLNLNAKTEGFYGMFDNFGHSVFTVYLAASEEGWVYVLYDCLDSLPTHLAVMYFITLIFFLAWLVKNVFIAVITETFAEIRVQFSELGFTVIFNVECLVKIVCYGLPQFWKRNIYKFELILCIGSSLNCIPFLYDRHVFTYFQVFRLLRLIKASPMLEEFVYKIFSPGKKLGGLVIFTILFVVMSSAVSLQLFCVVPHLHHFQTFPQAFMCMFQIITQEGWPELVVDVLRMTDDRMVPFVAIYFVAYHLFVTLIVLSLFVAVILDNLEMDEMLKKAKQLKAKEAVTSMRTILPARLRVFERFPTRPQMVQLKKADNEFTVPRMRDSFAHQFVLGCDSSGNQQYQIHQTEEFGNRKLILKSMSHYLHHRKQPILTRHIGQLTMRSSLQALIQNSSNQPRKDSFREKRARHMSLFETMNENGDVLRSGVDSTSRRDIKQGEIDIRALQHKQQIAEMTRTRIERELKENHPFFDCPLFLVGRDSKLRRFCRQWVHARGGESTTTTKTQRRYKQFHGLIGLMPYLDWIMVVITLISCASMLYESPWPTTGENLVMKNFYLQIADYIFVMAMTFELSFKIIADGLFFTPSALVRDFGGVMTLFIYITSVIFLFTMPKHVEINSN
ncbi:hypothetical protein M3Y97_00471800 [Aphelenchoides bicaudatus]|nr:hypothetical protein M3Y97_00471800 [Aphelenchoides bicaudatus]